MGFDDNFLCETGSVKKLSDTREIGILDQFQNFYILDEYIIESMIDAFIEEDDLLFIDFMGFYLDLTGEAVMDFAIWIEVKNILCEYMSDEQETLMKI